MTAPTPEGRASRRAFLQTTAAAGASLAAISLAPHVSGGDATKTLRVGLVGCGGRGTGAAANALNADPNVKLVAMGDVFADRLGQSLANLAGDEKLAKKIDVPKEQQFVGFDAYKGVLECCDVVLLCTPPGFRPLHLDAAVKAGKHVFAEKPVAVDAPGVRSVLATCAEAKKKKLSIVSGLCWRYHHGKRETMKRVHDGAVGDIVALQCSYNAGPLWMKPRQKQWTDVEWQLRNWLYFTWLSGDHIVEQAVHSLDKMAWAMKDEYPERANGMGGRQVRTDPAYGHIFDHFAIVYEYKNGVKLFHYCRQQAGCTNDVTDHVLGTKGTCDVMKHAITGANEWRHRPPRGFVDDMYQTEHDELFASVRKGEPINNGDYMTRSTMLAILGRMAAYTGKTITWKQAMNSKEKLGPDKHEFGELPVPAVAKPGVTKFI